MNSKRVWIYCRTAHPDMVALADQKRYMIDYAEKQGFTIAGVTAEHGSGLDISRNGIKEVSGAIEAGKTDALLVRDPARLSRDLEEMDAYLHWLKKHGVELICADGTLPMSYADMLRNLEKEHYGHNSEAGVG